MAIHSAGLLTLLIALSCSITSIAVDEGLWMVNGVHVQVYKSVTPFNSYINLAGGGMLALHLGAEYYVHAPRTSQYRKATTTMLLPGRTTPGVNPSATLYTNGTSRIPCFLFAVLDNISGKSVDVGVEYVAGRGWFAFYWANGFSSLTKARDESINSYPTATQVDVTVEVLDATTVRGTFTFTISTPGGGTRMECSRLVFSTCEPFLPSGTSPPGPIFRFARNMAFLSGWGADNYVYDKSDNTVMTDAQFLNIQLWDASGTAWPWNWDLIDYAWAVQMNNIVSIKIINTNTASPNDQLSIIQRVWYPLRCVTITNKCAANRLLTSSAPRTDATAPYNKRWNVTGWTTLVPNQNITSCWDNNVAASEWHFYQDAYVISGQTTVPRCTDYSLNPFVLLELDNKSVPPAPAGNYFNVLGNKNSSSCSSTLGAGVWSTKPYYRLPFTDGSYLGWNYNICGGNTASQGGTPSYFVSKQAKARTAAQFNSISGSLPESASAASGSGAPSTEEQPPPVTATAALGTAGTAGGSEGASVSDSGAGGN